MKRDEVKITIPKKYNAKEPLNNASVTYCKQGSCHK